MRSTLHLIALLLPLPPLFAAPPQQTVLRLVPPDAAVVLVVQNLRDHADAVAKSPFANWANGALAGKLPGGNQAEMILGADLFLKAQLGLTLKDLRDDIFAEILVHASKPALTGKPEDDESVFLLHARDAKKLEILIDKLNALQKAGGEVKDVQPHTHNGRPYFERTKPRGRGDFYHLDGALFVYASHETALKAVLDRIAAKADDSKVLQALTDRGVADAFLACVIQPRGFDAEMLKSDATDTAAEKAGKAQMAKLWAALDQCVVYLHAGKELELGVALAYRPADLPAEMRSLLAGPPRQSPLWQAVPTDALAAVTFQAETGVLLDAVSSFLPVADRSKLKAQFEDLIGNVLGAAKIPGVMKGLGPDLGLWAVPRASAWFPDIVAAMHLQPQPGDLPADISEICGFYLRLFQFKVNNGNPQKVLLKELRDGDVVLRQLVNDKLFPPGVTPTVAVQKDYLVAASSPEAYRTFKAPQTAETPRSESPVLFVSSKAIHAHLTAHQQPMAAWIAERQGRPAADVVAEMNTLLPALEAIDRVEMVVRGDDKSRTLAVKVKMIQALK